MIKERSHTMLNYLETIKEKLIELKPYKAILFGSYAYGKIHDNDVETCVGLVDVLNREDKGLPVPSGL